MLIFLYICILPPEFSIRERKTNLMILTSVSQFFFILLKLITRPAPYRFPPHPQKQIKGKPYLMLLLYWVGHKVHSGLCTLLPNEFFGQPNICFLPKRPPQGSGLPSASWAACFPAEQRCSQPCGATPVTARNSIHHMDVCASSLTLTMTLLTMLFPEQMKTIPGQETCFWLWGGCSSRVFFFNCFLENGNFMLERFQNDLPSC